ncbi:MAG TPA: phospholipase D-like domain-containing protein, partial [Candidatus Xenobia bacterium]
MITPFMSGHKVRLLTDTAHARTPEDDIFCQVDRLLDEARDIRIEMYSLDQPDIVDKLIARARQGVPVEIVLDPPRKDIRDVGKAEAMVRLAEAGAMVRISPLQRSNQRDHVKLLVVDGCKAIIGGMNWGGHSPQNHDYDLLVEGPLVADMLGPFNLHAPAPGAVGDTSLRLLTSDLNERSIEQAVHQAI